MVKNPYPKGLRLKMLKKEEKFSSIASAISPAGSALGVQIFTQFLFIFFTQQILK
jgi:hypothetical protein